MLTESVLSPSWAKFKGLTIPLPRVALISKVFLPGVFFLTIVISAPQTLAGLGDNGQITQPTSVCSQLDLEQMLGQ